MAMNTMNHKQETNKAIPTRKNKEVDNDDKRGTRTRNQRGNCD
jgi:hypothetical protein